MDVTTFCCSKPAFIATRTPEDEGALAHDYQEEEPACDKEAHESDLSREIKMSEAI